MKANVGRLRSQFSILFTNLTIVAPNCPSHLTVRHQIVWHLTVRHQIVPHQTVQHQIVPAPNCPTPNCPRTQLSDTKLSGTKLSPHQIVPAPNCPAPNCPAPNCPVTIWCVVALLRTKNLILLGRATYTPHKNRSLVQRPFHIYILTIRNGSASFQGNWSSMTLMFFCPTTSNFFIMS